MKTSIILYLHISSNGIYAKGGICTDEDIGDATHVVW